MSEFTNFIEASVLFAIAGFILGWIACEIYQYYRDYKEKRWHSSPKRKW
jgi:ABC-type polysaccharide/polyol phosphate export permease